MAIFSTLALSFEPARVIQPTGGLSTEGIGIWVAALLTLMIYSFLYKDNPFYKAAESLFAGISIGYLFGTNYQPVFLPKVYLPLKMFVEKVVARQPLTTGDWGSLNVLVPALIGLCTLFPFIYPRLGWLTTLPFALIIGYGAGLNIPTNITAIILGQMEGTLRPFYQYSARNPDPILFLSSLFVLMGVLATLSYFFFSAEHRGALGVSSRLGIWFVMVGFGAAFGLTVMARVSLLIGRVEFLLHDWLHII